MTSPACYLQGKAPGPLRPLPSGEPDGTAPVFGATIDNLDLFRRATQMMATGALTDDQARTLSRQILTSAAWSPGC